MKIFVEWTGSYPTLCFGQWNISIDGISLTGLGNEEFDTRKSYDTWHFDDDWSEEWDSYTAGLSPESWVQLMLKHDTNSLVSSLKRHGFKDIEKILYALYPHINEEDWRHSSCGGCI
ncbi:hypothetical protein KNT81_gp265 [Proteus phage phiP4-3]|uniref:Uncharacterized protein n=1 Tax=Proteus phage phiP4-3 TaxID=2065203 RepID=A0A2I6PFK1_9CAUD|nr:hypothetical protein KNT81_gp265 [Proteus phage phiP4-3]AUM58506.1 hypothetical protein phiP43_148 [Proteus phage phiP4-3]